MGDRHAPHLQDRNQASIDATDREIVWGEVYLVDQGVNAVLWEVCNENEKQRQRRDQPERPCAWLRPLNRPRSWEEVQRIIKETGPGRLCPLHMSDGPILLDALRERIVGRVIGLYQHPGYRNCGPAPSSTTSPCRPYPACPRPSAARRYCPGWRASPIPARVEGRNACV